MPETAPAPLPPVADSEELARFVFNRRNIREDNTIKPDEFVPYKYVELSVTRHLGLDESQIWGHGLNVGLQRNLTLLGRADVSAANYRGVRLAVEPDPTATNPNHANVKGWPADKATQKMVATEIAAKARFAAYVA